MVANINKAHLQHNKLFSEERTYCTQGSLPIRYFSSLGKHTYI